MNCTLLKRRPPFSVILIAFGVLCTAHAQIVPDGTGQPVEARSNQLADFPLLILVAQNLGIVPTPASNAFWFDSPSPVGPVVVQFVVPGSAADIAGLLAGDSIVELRRIPHYQRALFFQKETIQGGAVQLGFNIQRARSFGFTKITLHVKRSSVELDLVLRIQ